MKNETFRNWIVTYRRFILADAERNRSERFVHGDRSNKRRTRVHRKMTDNVVA